LFHNLECHNEISLAIIFFYYILYPGLMMTTYVAETCCLIDYR
jgi:hypothetical protein